jgi:MGT family glycosyltransferase
MRVLAYTSPARGHLFPTMPVLLELQRRGHDVTVATVGVDVPALRDMGFDARAVDPAIAQITHDDYLAGSPIEGIKRSVRVMNRRAPLEVADLRRLIDETRPDALLIDTNTWGAAALAEAHGAPWAMLQHFPAPMPDRDVPPFGPGLRPAKGFMGRMRDRMLRPIILGGFERILIPPLNELRRSVGLDGLRDVEDLYTRPPLTIYPTSTAFEYPRERWPESFCFIGPSTWDPPAEKPAWLDELEQPIVLVTTSSEFQDDGDLVRSALDGLADEDCDVVATMPAGSGSIDVPANARIETFVPHSRVLERAVVTVTHGGMGTTQKALCAGVPVVVVPWGRDQAEVGRRAEAAGVGVVIPRKRLTPERIRAAVRDARRLRPAAARFAEAMRREPGPALAVDRLEELVGRGAPTSAA